MLALSEIDRPAGQAAVAGTAARGARACVAGPLRRLGFRIPDEVVNQLRFGRGVDNRLLKATGFRYGYTTRETVLKLGEHLRLAPVMRGVERDVHLRARGRGVPALEPATCAGSIPGERGGVAADREPLGI